MLLRGALTAGKITISDDLKLIVGPAFIEAYALESENAIFPRIIIDNEITKYLDKKNISFKYIKEDGDNLSYLDFLGYEIDIEHYNKQTLNHVLKTNGVKEGVKERYFGYLNKNKKIAQKYGWLISKLKEQGIKII
jgi:pimeloyl-CoA synthetase